MKEEEFTQGVNAAVAMLEKIAVDHCEKHAWTDPDTGVRELKPGPIEDYYDTVMELAGNVRSIVHAPESRDIKMAPDARNELVTAIHTLASHFENTLYALRNDAEAMAKAKGDIAHAMKIAAKHNTNGAARATEGSAT